MINRRTHSAALVLALMGMAGMAGAESPKKEPARNPERDTEKLKEADGKRAKKAAKRANVAAMKAAANTRLTCRAHDEV